MPASAVAAFAVLVVLFVSVAQRFERVHLTAPIVFTAVGALLARTVVTQYADTELVRGLAELTLALVLFHDAAQVRPRQLRSDAALCARLLLVGLPLTMLVGFGAARLLFGSSSVWLALLLAAAVSPTDAGLGAATVLNPAVPVRVRRILNVESGLNDGLATPVVLFALAALSTTSGGVEHALRTAVEGLAVGVVVGVLLGAACGRLMSQALRSGWLAGELLPIGTLVVPLLTYYGSVAVHGNGFVAAFVSGTAFAAAGTRVPAPEQPEVGGRALALTDSLSVLLGYAVWLLFGIVAVGHLGGMLSWAGLVFAVLSLTVLRMLPVALSLVGTGLRAPTVLFVGWFGPRGLASVVFALIAVEELTPRPDLQPVLGAIGTTVVLSVVLHGLTAAPWAARYGAWVASARPQVELVRSVEPVRTRGAVAAPR